ncbi:MAG: hypothetical protein U0531_10430 [Dehalococcoidia bacterium]
MRDREELIQAGDVVEAGRQRRRGIATGVEPHDAVTAAACVTEAERVADFMQHGGDLLVARQESKPAGLTTTTAFITQHAFAGARTVQAAPSMSTAPVIANTLGSSFKRSRPMRMCGWGKPSMQAVSFRISRQTRPRSAASAHRSSAVSAAARVVASLSEHTPTWMVGAVSQK